MTLFGRLIPLVRAIVSVPAGIARMPFWRFTLYTVIGSLPWCIGFAWLGYELGNQWTKVEDILSPIAYAVAALLVVGLIVFVARRWKQVRAEYAAIDAAREAK